MEPTKTIDAAAARRELIDWITDTVGCDLECLAQLYSVISPDPVQLVGKDGDASGVWEGGDPSAFCIDARVWTVGPHGQPNAHTDRIGLGRVRGYHVETNNGNQEMFAYVQFQDGKQGSWPVAQLRTAK
jgi:hypothetical protein